MQIMKILLILVNQIDPSVDSEIQQSLQQNFVHLQNGNKGTPVKSPLRISSYGLPKEEKEQMKLILTLTKKMEEEKQTLRDQLEEQKQLRESERVQWEEERASLQEQLNKKNELQATEFTRDEGREELITFLKEKYNSPFSFWLFSSYKSPFSVDYSITCAWQPN